MIMEKLNTDRKSLRKFGITMATVFIVLTLFILVRHKLNPWPSAIIAVVFLGLGFCAPPFLRPVYIFWMRLAHALGYVNTRLILFILYYLILTPVGLAMRLFSGDPLDREFSKGAPTYWRQVEKKLFNPADYERQF
jgi:hypothetical protein